VSACLPACLPACLHTYMQCEQHICQARDKWKPGDQQASLLLLILILLILLPFDLGKSLEI
jgi:hypothetical protein